ncbi:hypothetical protein TIFTF001_050189 [Ficus carica]|uniref:Uncharacterized protein n=1 Tax=Ficus carica TaxID=3494 RepID=A0AA87Z635_FICCA|nr:hypothetical protein TIFTF001_050183 [Ficus carica]GMN22165.1 hypothetical protein TIFTF001_050184 [Ficus carica]GMN22211.1 hypothetical protein TIFTF001_050188 [Ficus carica]GMN22225.1 hypothetical protein TIFTF001_050189 [Ficus carica]
MMPMNSGRDYEVIVPTVSQSWLRSHKCNLATSIADGLQPLPRSRPTSKDPSLHPFLSSSSSPSTASLTEPSRCYNHAGDSDKGDYSGTVCCVDAIAIPIWGFVWRFGVGFA